MPTTQPVESPSPSATIAATIAGAADCTIHVDDSGYTNSSVIRENLSCAVDLFAWPDDRRPTERDLDGVINSLPQSESARFQNGYEFTTLGPINYCQWSFAWLDAHATGDEIAAENALYWIGEAHPNLEDLIPEHPVGIIDDSVRNAQRQYAQAAQLGDPGPIQTWVDHNCTDLADY